MTLPVALDTNLLVRLLTNDDPQQARRVADLIDASSACFVPITVVLELEWVLRGYYGFAREEVASVLDHLLRLPQATVEDRALVERALHNLRAGLDFADALHHASYTACSQVATFDDRGFARRARRLGLAPGVEVPR